MSHLLTNAIASAMETSDLLFDSSVTLWWSKIEAKNHPLDKATEGKVSSAVLEAEEPLEEHFLVNEVLYMLQGLECELFTLEEKENEGEEDGNEDSMTSKRFEGLWRWTLRRKSSSCAKVGSHSPKSPPFSALHHSSRNPSLLHLTSSSLYPQLLHFIRLATSLSRLKMTIQVSKHNYGSSTAIFASCLEEHIFSAESFIQKIQNYHQLNHTSSSTASGSRNKLHSSQSSNNSNASLPKGDTPNAKGHAHKSSSMPSSNASSSINDFIQLLIASKDPKSSASNASPFTSHFASSQGPNITLIGLHSLIGRVREVVEYLERIAKLATAPLPSLDYSPHVDDLYPDRPKKSKAARAASIFSVLEEEMAAMQADSEWKQTLLMKFAWRLIIPLLEKVDLWTIHSYLSHDDTDEFCIIRRGSTSSSSIISQSGSTSLHPEAPSIALPSSSYDITSPLFWSYTFDVNKEYPSFLKSSISHILTCGKASLLIKYIQQEVFHQKQEEIGQEEVFEPLFRSTEKNFSRLYLPSNSSLYAPTPEDFFFEESLPLAVPKVDAQSDDLASGRRALSFRSPDAIVSRLPSSSNSALQNGVKNTSPSHNKEFSSKTRSETRFFSAASFGEYSDWPTSDESAARESSTVGESLMVADNPNASVQDSSRFGHNGIPFSAFIADCIFQPISLRYTSINQKLMSLLINDFGVLKRIKVAQKFYFLSQPMADLFSLSIFPMLWNHVNVGEVTLNHCLKLAIESTTNGPKFDSDLSEYYYGASLHISLAAAAATFKADSLYKQDIVPLLRDLDDISAVGIRFDIPWPASLVIDGKLYNSIFESLTPLMASQFALEQLTMQNKFVTKETNFVVHQMHLFKNELLCYLRSLREYMISRVLQVPWKELEKELKSATSIDDLRSRHDAYLLQIQERCLLTSRFVALRRPLDKLIGIAITFARRFQLVHTLLNDPVFPSGTYKKSEHAAKFGHLVLGMEVEDKVDVAAVWSSVLALKADFTKNLKFVLSVLSKMASSSTHLADLYLRLNFSDFYQQESQRL